MIYDKILLVCSLTDDRPRALSVECCYGYADQTVYHRRHWEAVQAGSRADRMVQVPFGGEIRADQFVWIPAESSAWRIEEAQHTTDGDSLPVTNLTLRREEAFYDVLEPAPDPSDSK